MKQKFTRLILFSLLLFPSGSVLAQRYEAENAEYSGVVQTCDGQQGTGAINLQESDSYVRFSVNVTESGEYNIYLGYGNPYDDDKQFYIDVNGARNNMTAESENTCAEKPVGKFTLNAGENRIEVLPNWTWFLVDYIRLESTADDGGGETPDVKGFKVSGAKLLDAKGNEFVMRGVNMAWTWYRQNGMAQLEAIARAGANTVRLVLSDGVQWTKDNATTVASLIQKCEDLKMIAIIEVHDATGRDDVADLEKAAQYFADMKNTLSGKESTVIIKIANEWYGSSGSGVNWRNGYKSAISILRNAGLHHCIMIDAGGWGQNVSNTLHTYGQELLNYDPEKNVMFSIHMYGTAGNTSVVKSNIDGVINRGLALCIGEFGWYHSDGDVDEALILSYCNEKEVGWLAWSWYGNGEGVEYLDLVTNPTDETKLNSPTTAGKSANWGKMIVDRWKAEAQICSVYGASTETETGKAGIQAAVYPTLVKEAVHVVCPDNNYSVSVTDVTGRLIFRTTATGETTTISCSNWNTGIFYLSVTGTNGIKTFPLIK